MSAADSFVLLTEQMKDMLKVGRKPYCVIDGLYSVKNKFEDAIENSGKTMVYTGSLHREYGICELLSAFCCEESEDWKLIIAGSGNAEDEVKKAEKEQSNIVFLGTLQMPEILKLQREATILVNPRPVDGIDAKYSFPSKTMEYMLSGRPVFMNLLPGMDPIYADYLLTPERFQTDSFKKALPMVMKMEQKELNMIG